MAFDQQIKILITGDGTQLSSALTGVSARLSAFAAKTTSTFGKIGALFSGLSAAGLAASVKQSIDAFEQLNASAQKTGVGVEALSALQYAAEQSETSFEALQKGLIKFARVQDAARDGSKEAMRALAAVGVTAKDTAEQGLAKIADAFAAMPDGARKTALAVDLFGKAGAELIPLLNNGSAGLAKFRAEAEKLGIVVSTKAAKAADEFNDSLDKVGKAGAALGYAAANTVLPAIGNIATAMADAATKGEGLTGVISALGTSLRRLINSGGAEQGILDELAWEEDQLKVLIGLRDKIEAKRATANYTSINPFADTKSSLGKDLDANLERIMVREEKVQKLYQELYRLQGVVGTSAEQASSKAEAGSDAAKQSANGWRDAVAATRAEYDNLAKSIAADLRGANADPLLKKSVDSASVLDINRLKDKARAALEGGDTKTAEEMIAKAQAINNALVDAGKITQGYYKTQAEQLLALAETGQTVVEGEPIEIPSSPDLQSAIDAGMLASETAQSAVTPITIPVEGISRGSSVNLSNPETITQLSPVAGLDGYAKGGLIAGKGSSTSDSILARLSAGEYVVKAAAVSKYGSGLLSAINSLRLPRFAAGGLVGAAAGNTASYRLDLNGRSMMASAPAAEAATFARELRREVLRRGRR